MIIVNPSFSYIRAYLRIEYDHGIRVDLVFIFDTTNSQIGLSSFNRVIKIIQLVILELAIELGNMYV